MSEPTLQPSRMTPYSGGTRAQDGVTVFASTDDGRHAVLVRSLMPIRGALLSICRELDAMPGRWFVDVISSPTTIWRDLTGSRSQPNPYGKGSRIITPEAKLLGSIGRGDLWRAG